MVSRAAEVCVSVIARGAGARGVERLLLESAVGHESIWSGSGQQVRGWCGRLHRLG